jgi:hypothetical protein
MIDAGIGIGLFDRVFHFDHGAPPAKLVFKMFQSFQLFQSFETRFLFKDSSVQSKGSAVISRGSFLRFDQTAVGAVTIGMFFRFPTAADGDGLRVLKLQNKRRHVCHRMGAVAKRQILASRAAAIGYTF